MIEGALLMEMTAMHEAWYDLFNTTRMVYFLAGIALGTGWFYRKLKREGTTVDLTPIGIIMGVSVIVFIAVQQVGLATEVKECQTQFNTVLQQRATLSDQSDSLADQEIQANAHWLATLTSPPPEISALHTTDPLYQQWVRGTIKDYLIQVNNIHDQRAASLQARKDKIYPTPTCGL
jgi:hypothetical protein